MNSVNTRLFYDQVYMHEALCLTGSFGYEYIPSMLVLCEVIIPSTDLS